MYNNNIILSKAKINCSYKIKGFIKPLSFYEKERFFSYGINPDNEIKIIRKSLLGNTFQVEVFGSTLVLRRKEADIVLVTGGDS